MSLALFTFYGGQDLSLLSLKVYLLILHPILAIVNLTLNLPPSLLAVHLPLSNSLLSIQKLPFSSFKGLLSVSEFPLSFGGQLGDKLVDVPTRLLQLLLESVKLHLLFNLLPQVFSLFLVSPPLRLYGPLILNFAMINL